MEKLVIKDNFWKGKKVLLTGHTGFKGSWFTIFLKSLGANVIGISLEPEEKKNNLFFEANIKNYCNSIFCDIRDFNLLNNHIKKINPEIVFHFAAQALVRDSYRDPLKTFNTNTLGTANILQSLSNIDSVRVAVFITTDKVYKNNDKTKSFKENDLLGGIDPYSASKSASEIIISCYKDSLLKNKNINIASARAGNVIGGGDWSKDRLIPDIIRSWSQNNKVIIRNPKATRPWQHVLDPLNGYLNLAEKLWKNEASSGAYNFGPSVDGNLTVENILYIASSFYEKGSFLVEKDKDNFYEAKTLVLDSSKSKKILKVKCKLSIEDAIKKTFNWYKKYNLGENAYNLCMKDLEFYKGIND